MPIAAIAHSLSAAKDQKRNGKYSFISLGLIWLLVTLKANSLKASASYYKADFIRSSTFLLQE